jgi:hypothetical protein
MKHDAASLVPCVACQATVTSSLPQFVIWWSLDFIFSQLSLYHADDITKSCLLNRWLTCIADWFVDGWCGISLSVYLRLAWYPVDGQCFTAWELSWEDDVNSDAYKVPWFAPVAVYSLWKIIKCVYLWDTFTYGLLQNQTFKRRLGPLSYNLEQF